MKFILLAHFSPYFDIVEHMNSPGFYLIVIKTSSDFLQELIRIRDQQRNVCSWIVYKVTFHDSLIKINVVVLFNYEIWNLISAFLSGKYWSWHFNWVYPRVHKLGGLDTSNYQSTGSPFLITTSEKFPPERDHFHSKSDR